MKNPNTPNNGNIPLYVRYCEKHDWYYAMSQEEFKKGHKCPICSGDLIPTVNFLQGRNLKFSADEDIYYIR